MNAAEQLVQETFQLWSPPPKQSVCEWAIENFYVSTGAEKGRFHPKAFQIEPLNTLSNPRIHTVVIMSATQMIKTILLLVGTGYVIAKDPDPIMFVAPRDSDVHKFSKFRLSPMLRDVEALHGKVSDWKSRNSQSTIDVKDFPGGPLILTAAGSPGNLAAFTIRYLFCDEIDKYPASAGAEGDPISLAIKRTAHFRSRRKIVLACSPTVEGESRIAKAYEDGDQREYYVPCWSCGTPQTLKWNKVTWDSTLPKEKQAATARYKCEECGELWTDAQRWKAIDAGHWVAAMPFSGTASFRINELASPWKTLPDIVGDFLEKKDDPEQLKTFVNTSLAETWRVRGEAPEWRRLYERSRNEPNKLGIVPEGALFLTAGVDVQGDRLECQVKGWGRGKQSWIVDYVVLEGRPTEPAVWLRLTEILGRIYPNQDGVEFSIAKMAVDTGYSTQDGYAWARQQAPGRVMAVKGMPHTHQAILGQPSAQDMNLRGRKIINGIQVWGVGVSAAKSELYGWLQLPTPTETELAEGGVHLPGYCHLSAELAEEFYEQLTAEELVSRKVKGYVVHEWVKKRDRNEALDTAVYARAAAAQVGIDRFQEPKWLEMERYIAREAAALKDGPLATVEPVRGTRRIAGSFI